MKGMKDREGAISILPLALLAAWREILLSPSRFRGASVLREEDAGVE